MKRLLVMLALIATTFAQAQTKYEAGMAKALVQLKEAKTKEDLVAASSFFERIGDAEKTQWLPYYYATLSLYKTGMQDKTADKDKIAEACNAILAKADAIDKTADLYCLHQQIAVLQMLVDPMSRWQTYGAVAKQALADAKTTDATNPRIYYLEGMTTFNTPEAFGGGKAAAKPLFQKSVDLFKTYVPATPFHPTWGKDDADKMLAACQ